MELKKITKDILGYFGGLIDGEGSIYIRYNTKRNQFGPVLSIKMNDIQGLQLFQSYFGGKINTCENFKNAAHTSYQLVYNTQKLHQILNLVLPHLRVKKSQAVVMLEFLNFKNQQSNNPSEDKTNIYKYFYYKLRSLKEKGWISNSKEKSILKKYPGYSIINNKSNNQQKLLFKDLGNYKYSLKILKKRTNTHKKLSNQEKHLFTQKKWGFSYQKSLSDYNMKYD